MHIWGCWYCPSNLDSSLWFIQYAFSMMYTASLEKKMVPHSSTLAWKIPWMEEPGRLQSMGSLRVGHDWATSLHFSLSCIGEGNGNPLQCSCLENPKDGGAWWAAVCGVWQSWTQLKWLSSSSNMKLIATAIYSNSIIVPIHYIPNIYNVRS